MSQAHPQKSRQKTTRYCSLLTLIIFSLTTLPTSQNAWALSVAVPSSSVGQEVAAGILAAKINTTVRQLENEKQQLTANRLDDDFIGAREEQIANMQQFLTQERFANVDLARAWSSEEIADLQATKDIKEAGGWSNYMANKLRRLLQEAQSQDKFIATGGVMDGNVAAAMAEAGHKALYLSGWQVSNHWGQPDLAKYPLQTVAEKIKEINKRLLNKHVDQQIRFNSMIRDLDAIFQDVFTQAQENSAAIDKGAVAEQLSRVILGGGTQIFVDSFRENEVPFLHDIFTSAIEQTIDQREPLDYARSKAIRNRVYNALKENLVDYLIPIFADGDTGHESVDEMVRLFIEAGASAIHLEDQLHGAKKCGHMAGKVLVSPAEHARRIQRARAAADRQAATLLIVARTDAEAAKLLSRRDDPDHSDFFIKGVTAEDLPSLAEIIRLAQRVSNTAILNHEGQLASLKRKYPELAENILNVWRLQGADKSGTRLNPLTPLYFEGNKKFAGTIYDIWQRSNQIYLDQKVNAKNGTNPQTVLMMETKLADQDGNSFTANELLSRKPRHVDDEMKAMQQLTEVWTKSAQLKTFVEAVADEIMTSTQKAYAGMSREARLTRLREWKRLTDPLKFPRSFDGEGENLQILAKTKFGISLYWNMEKAKTYEGFYQIESKYQSIDGEQIDYGVINASVRGRIFKEAGADINWMEQAKPKAKQAAIYTSNVKPSGSQPLYDSETGEFVTTVDTIWNHSKAFRDGHFPLKLTDRLALLGGDLNEAVYKVDGLTGIVGHVGTVKSVRADLQKIKAGKSRIIYPTDRLVRARDVNTESGTLKENPTFLTVSDFTLATVQEILNENVFFSINLSPSFNWSNAEAWSDALTSDEIKAVARTMAKSDFLWHDPDTWGRGAQYNAVKKMHTAIANFSFEMAAAGFVFQFVTVFNDHVSALQIYLAAKKLAAKGAGEYVFNVQQMEQMVRARFLEHQAAAGVKMVASQDAVHQRGSTATGAVGKGATSAQFGARRNQKDDLLEIAQPVIDGGFTREAGTLNSHAQKLTARLTKKYGNAIDEALKARDRYYRDLQSGTITPGFLGADTLVEDAYGGRSTVQDIRTGNWRVDEVPEALRRAGAILTGPWATTSWAINALGNKADPRLEAFLRQPGNTLEDYIKRYVPVRIFVDNEDAADHGGINNWEQKQVVKDVISGSVTSFEKTALDGTVLKKYELFDREHWPVITTRTRGLHLEEKYLTYDGQNVPGIIWDLVSYVENNLENLQSKNGYGAYVVIPKLQSAAELKLVTQMIMDLESEFQLPIGSIKIILMVETIEMTLQLEEAIWAARHHVVVDNAGRWDMMATYIRLMWLWKRQLYPDVFGVNMKSPNMAAYAKRVVDIARKRGLIPEGGMDVTMMSEKKRGSGKSDKETLRNYYNTLLSRFGLNEETLPTGFFDQIYENLGSYPEADLFAVLNTVAGKMDEAKKQFPSAWLASPTLVPFVQWIFQQAFPDGYTVSPEDVSINIDYSSRELANLLALPEGQNTLEGVKKTVYYLVSYMIGVRNLGGAVAILHPEEADISRNGGREMDDFATAKINFYKIWTLMQSEPKIQDNEGKEITLTREMILNIVSEQVRFAQKRILDITGNSDTFGISEWQIVDDLIKQLISRPELHLWESQVIYAGINERDPARVAAITRQVLSLPHRQQLETTKNQGTLTLKAA